MKFTTEKAIEAEKRVKEAYEEAAKARMRYENSKKAFADTIAEIFEERIAKRGEKITSASGETYYYSGIRYEGYTPEVICYPMKKDGTPSKALRYVYLSNFVETL
jgi:hypothetical protein